jgi:hypothetical protein
MKTLSDKINITDIGTKNYIRLEIVVWLCKIFADFREKKECKIGGLTKNHFWEIQRGNLNCIYTNLTFALTHTELRNRLDKNWINRVQHNEKNIPLLRR